MAKDSSSVRKKHLSPAAIHQIQILTALASGMTPQGETRKVDLHEIASSSGIRDEKETQRFLFILEGQKLVSPFPVGDFTSKTWFITDQGLQALRHISSSVAA